MRASVVRSVRCWCLPETGQQSRFEVPAYKLGCRRCWFEWEFDDGRCSGIPSPGLDFLNILGAFARPYSLNKRLFPQTNG